VIGILPDHTVDDMCVAPDKDPPPVGFNAFYNDRCCLCGTGRCIGHEAAGAVYEHRLDVQLEKRGSSRLPDVLARLTGECSWQTNIGNDVGVEPTTPRVMVLCSTNELVVVVEPVGPGPC
jgi:hypothetical protein